jgi:hypothetical protein
MIKDFLIGSAIAIGVVLYFVPNDYTDRKNTSEESKKAVWIYSGKKAVREKLKDPQSAKFRNVYFNKRSTGLSMTCGEVNSKNSFGAFTGFQKFISAGRSDTTFLQEQVDDFRTAWNKYCR